MIAENVKKSNIGVGIGFLLEIAGRVLLVLGAGQNGSPANVPLIILGGAVFVAGVGLFLWGCFQYAAGKGYSPLLGLLGFLSCIGLIVLIVLPDKTKGGPPPGDYRPQGSSAPGVWPPPPNI